MFVSCSKECKGWTLNKSTKNFETKFIIEENNVDFNKLCWMPSATSFGCGGSDGKVIICNLDGKIVNSIECGYAITSLDFHSSGMYMATGGLKTSIDLWDPKNGTKLKSFTAHQNTITAVKFSSKRLLVSADSDGTIVYHKFVGKKPRPHFLSESSKFTAIQDLAFSNHEENIFAHCEESGDIRIWDIDESKVIQEFKDHSSICKCILFNPRDNVLCSGGHDGKLIFHDLREKNNVKSIMINISTPISSFDYDLNGILIGIGSTTGSVLLYDLRNHSKPLLTIENAHDKSVESIKWRTGSSNFPLSVYTTPKKLQSALLGSSLRSNSSRKLSLRSQQSLLNSPTKLTYDEKVDNNNNNENNSITPLQPSHIKFDIYDETSDTGSSRRITRSSKRKELSTPIINSPSKRQSLISMSDLPSNNKSLSPKVKKTGDSELTEDPFSEYHWNKIKDEINNSVQQLKGDIIQEIHNVHFELLRQFHLQYNDLQELFVSLGVNKELLEEIKKLKEENQRLRNLIP